eukprot:COSAG02_NODE_4627_length_5151_cov_2.807601_4_plen_117_part_00
MSVNDAYVRTRGVARNLVHHAACCLIVEKRIYTLAAAAKQRVMTHSVTNDVIHSLYLIISTPFYQNAIMYNCACIGYFAQIHVALHQDHKWYLTAPFGSRETLGPRVVASLSTCCP